MATLSELAGTEAEDFQKRVRIVLFEKADEVLLDPGSYTANEMAYAKIVYKNEANLDAVEFAVLTNPTIQALSNPYNVSDTDLRFAVKTEQFPLLADANA